MEGGAKRSGAGRGGAGGESSLSQAPDLSVDREDGGMGVGPEGEGGREGGRGPHC